MRATRETTSGVAGERARRGTFGCRTTRSLPMNRAIAFTLVFLSFASFANAADEEAADAMITRGLELRRARKDAEALEMFQRADMLAPSARTAGQLGLVESALAHWSVAEAHLVASLSTPQDPWVH